MKTEKPVQTENQKSFTIELPLGLVGFPSIKQLVVEELPEEAPFLRLRDTQALSLEFLAIKPYGIIPDYVVEISEEDQDFIAATDADSVLILNIVTVHHDLLKKVTVNLIGPILVNKDTKKAKQVVINNYNDYSAWYVLFEDTDALPQAARA